MVEVANLKSYFPASDYMYHNKLKKNADKAAFMDIMKYENIITIIQHS
jgi:hypothetical protein